MVDITPGPAHQCASAAPQIVQGPIRGPRFELQIRLVMTEVIQVLLAGGRKDVGAALEFWQAGQNCAGRSAEWNKVSDPGLVPLRWNSPIVPVHFAPRHQGRL